MSARDDSPDLVVAKQLLDLAKDLGFVFERIATGEDGPLRGLRESVEWVDEIWIGGFGEGCTAIRRRRYSLIVPGGLPITEQVSGDALTVLHRVVRVWSQSEVRGDA